MNQVGSAARHCDGLRDVIAELALSLLLQQFLLDGLLCHGNLTGRLILTTGRRLPGMILIVSRNCGVFVSMSLSRSPHRSGASGCVAFSFASIWSAAARHRQWGPVCAFSR